MGPIEVGRPGSDQPGQGTRGSGCRDPNLTCGPEPFAILCGGDVRELNGALRCFCGGYWPRRVKTHAMLQFPLSTASGPPFLGERE